MNRKILLFILILAISGFAAAETTVTPGEETVIDSNISETEVVSSDPLEASIQGEELVVSPELDFPAGGLDQEVEFENSTESYSIEVEEVSNWSISPESFSDSVDLGSSGEINAFTAVTEGNTGADLELETEGEVFEYVSLPNDLRLIQGLDRDIFLSYQVREGAEHGTYNGTVNVSGMDQSQELDVELVLEDNIDPVIEEVNFTDYMSGQSQNFTVEASDNGEIESVTASVEEKVMVNGSEEWEPLSDFRFDEVPNSDLYRLDAGIEAPGEYRADVVVEDAAGNSANESASFEVSLLDALNIDNSETLVLPVHRQGSEISEPIGEISPGTDVEITLEEFSQDMDLQEWEISVLSDEEGPQYFNDENSTVSLDQEANLSLRVESNVETSFNGRLSFDGLQYHREVDDLSFSGEYVDCPVPQREVYEVLDRNVTLDPVNSDECEEAGWEVSYFAGADTVSSNSDLDSSISILTPNELKEEQRMIQEQIINEKESSISFWQNIAVALFLFTGVSIYSIMFAVYQLPYMMHFDISRTERKSKIAKRREKLGI